MSCHCDSFTFTFLYKIFEFTGPKTSKLEYLYRFYRKNLAKVTGPNQFLLAVDHRTTAEADDWVYKHLLMKQDFTCQFFISVQALLQ
jgi:glutamate dehydrogenase/leucine dehydrogenase